MAKVRSFIYPVSFGEGLDGTDSNNCSVRALANATGKPYQDCYKIFEQAGRKKHTGTKAEVFGKVYVEAGAKYVGHFGTTNQAYTHHWYTSKGLGVPEAEIDNQEPHKGCTLATFIKNNPIGTFIVIVKGHGTCVKNGVIIDSHPQRGTATVYTAFKFD